MGTVKRYIYYNINNIDAWSQMYITRKRVHSQTRLDTLIIITLRIGILRVYGGRCGLESDFHNIPINTQSTARTQQ